MKEINKLITNIKNLFWCAYIKPEEKTVGVYQGEKELKFANGNKDLKKLTKKGFKIQMVIR